MAVSLLIGVDLLFGNTVAFERPTASFASWYDAVGPCRFDVLDARLSRPST
jgi:hypothetical protein